METIYDEEKFSNLETPDLYFAAFLRVKGCLITNTVKQGSRTIFDFAVPNDKDFKSAYFNQLDNEDGYVNASKYSNAIKDLKTLCHVKTD